MTAIEQHDPTDDLPLLTRVVDEDAQDGLPTLTEVIEESQSGVSPADAPAIAEDGLPMLTEAIAAEPAPGDEAIPQVAEGIAPSTALSEANIQQLAQRLEAHLESVFTQKLSHRLEQLQRLAVEQAVGELRAELPQMLRDALGAPDTSR